MNELNKISDEKLVELCKKQLPDDHSGFEILVNRYKNYIFKIAYSKLKNYQDAEDATQETFIRIFFSIKKFREASTLKTWINVITTNVCLTMILTQKRKGWKYYLTENGEIDINNIYNSILSERQEQDFWTIVGVILKKMKSAYRKVFIYKYFKNFTIKSISKKIKISLNATKMKVKRSKDQFINYFLRNYGK